MATQQNIYALMYNDISSSKGPFPIKLDGRKYELEFGRKDVIDTFLYLLDTGFATGSIDDSYHALQLEVTSFKAERDN